LKKIDFIVTKKTDRITENYIQLSVENQIADKLSSLLDIAYLNIRLNSIIRQTIKNGLTNKE